MKAEQETQLCESLALLRPINQSPVDMRERLRERLTQSLASPDLPSSADSVSALARVAKAIKSSPLAGLVALGGATIVATALALHTPAEPQNDAPTSGIETLESLPTASASEVKISQHSRPAVRQEGPRRTSRMRSPALEPKSAATATATVPSDSLHEEMLLIEQARSVLRQNAIDEVRKLLGDYRQRFPKGQLMEQSQALECEVMAASKNTTSAHDCARSFLDLHPGSIATARMRRLIQELEQ